MCSENDWYVGKSGGMDSNWEAIVKMQAEEGRVWRATIQVPSAATPPYSYVLWIKSWL